MTYQKFLSLDLELNNGPQTERPKIIQIGIAIGAIEEPETEWVIRKWYLDPEEPIFPFITDLTGITDQDIYQHAVSHEQAATELSALIREHNTFVNPVTWGGGDSTELLEEFRDRSVNFPHFGRRWIDVKTYFVIQQLVSGKTYSGGLRSTMERHKLKFIGDAHRADVDAFNTLRLFAYFVNRQRAINGIINQVKEL